MKYAQIYTVLKFRQLEVPSISKVGQNHIYIYIYTVIYGNFSREIAKCTVIYGAGQP
jgi:hypothetical protein